MTTDGLERLDVWRKAKEFAVQVYREVIPLLPAEEKWALAMQLRRSTLSIPANLAEGYGRFYYQENIRFCYIARGSLEESLSHLTLAFELGFLSEPPYKALLQNGNDLDRLVCGYIAYLKKSRRGEKEPGAPGSISEEHAEYQPDLDYPIDSTVLGSLACTVTIGSGVSDLDAKKEQR